MTTEPLYGAVDWGGSWIRTALVEGREILIAEKVRRPRALDEQFDVIARSLQSCESRLGGTAAALGVGIAGIVQGSEVVSAINLDIHGSVDIAAALAPLTGRPVFLCNDIQAVAGSLRHRWPDEIVALVSMGTGIGGAILSRGAVLTGAGAAGDFGHLVLEPDGPPCDCGGHGCLETAVSGRVLAEAALALARSGASPALRRAAVDRDLHAGDLEAAAMAGDGAAQLVLWNAAKAFAVGLRSLVAAVDPDRIVLLGAMLRPAGEFGRLLREHWSQRRPTWSDPEMTFVEEDETSALVGAAAFAAERLEARSDKKSD